MTQSNNDPRVLHRWCGSFEVPILRWHVASNGHVHMRATCASCHGAIGLVVQTPALVAEADRQGLPAIYGKRSKGQRRAEEAAVTAGHALPVVEL